MEFYFVALYSCKERKVRIHFLCFRLKFEHWPLISASPSPDVVFFFLTNEYRMTLLKCDKLHNSHLFFHQIEAWETHFRIVLSKNPNWWRKYNFSSYLNRRSAPLVPSEKTRRHLRLCNPEWTGHLTCRRLEELFDFWQMMKATVVCLPPVFKNETPEMCVHTLLVVLELLF